MRSPGIRRRDERGVVFPSPVVMLSIIAIAMAGIAFLATRGGDEVSREVTTVAGADHAKADRQAQDGTSDANQGSAKDKAKSSEKSQKPERKTPPPVQRGKVYVEVYNNSGITGLAGSVAGRARDAGWQVVGADNWYGSIPTSTVYYPQRLERAARLLARDLGVHRVAPAVDPMRLDRLTLILTGQVG